MRPGRCTDRTWTPVEYAYGCRPAIMTGRLVRMTEHRTSTRPGTVYLAQRRVAVGMTLGIVAGVVWAVSMICTLVTWAL